MIKVSIDTTELDRLSVAFKGVDFKSVLQTEITTAGTKIGFVAKQLVKGGYGRPVYQTGYLHDHIKSLYPRPLTTIIESQASYSQYPHEGTGTSRKYGPRPFMKDAAMSEAKNIKTRIENAINKIIKSLDAKVG